MKRMVFRLLFLLLFFVACPARAQAPVIRVGVYQNEPLVFVDEGGQAQGLYVDLLEAIAAEEGWELEYVACTFPDCLALLERGDLDLMTAIAYSEEREERFDFTRETVWANWGQVYTREGGPQSLLDLEDRTVAVVREDIYYTRFRTLLERFGVSCTFVEVDDYAPVLERVAAGEVDAGLVSRLYGLRHAEAYDVLPSPIVCCPSDLRIAAPGGKNADLLATIDHYLTAWKEAPDSLYYHALGRWFAAAVAEPTLLEQAPLWLKWLALAAAAAAVLGFGGSLLLRAQVRARTRELEAEVARRIQSEEATRRYAERLRSLREIDRAILEARSPEETAHAALQNLRGLVPHLLGAWVADIDIGRKEVRVLAVTTERADRPLVQVGGRIPWDRFSAMPETVATLQRGEARIVEDLTSHPSPVARMLVEHGYRAFVTVPMRHRGELVGMLGIGKAEPGATEEELEIAREVADVLTVAVQQARLRRELERHAEELEELVAERTRQLAESEARYRQLVESPLVGIWQADVEGHIQFVNRRLAEMGGYTPEELVGKNILDVVASELRSQLEERMQMRREGRLSDQPIEVVLVRKDGSRLTVLSASASLYDIEGNLVGFIGAVIDISDRKELEQRLEEQNREYRRLIDLMTGREIRMAELKEVIRRLRAQLLEAGLTPVADDPLRAGEE